ncbi:1143_t:CDS:1 [Ambispora gerdemannii]|uniref:1143_t:CDS:1 n=1 Tax=Ambispora gerdemannii TaxID=144530 RepID=A0A9N9CYI5_9GLOM|nr:1143_t:CDS:1 [Ambispora gerdemannii]
MNNDIEFELIIGNRRSEPSVDVYKIKMNLAKIEKETLSIPSVNRIWSWKPGKRDKPEYSKFSPAEIKPVLYKEKPADKGQHAILTIDDIYDNNTNKYLYSEVLVLPYIKDTNGHPLPPKSPLLKLPLNGNIGNWHSVELIPDSNGLLCLVAIADSYGTVHVFTKEGKRKNTLKLPHAHGLVWDNKTSTLFALGHTDLQTYQLDPKDPTNLKLLTTLDFSEHYEKKNESEENKDGGHDLCPVPGERKLFLTTGERTFKFDIDEYEKLIPKGGKILECYNLKKGERILKPYQPMFKIDSKYWRNIASDNVPPAEKGLKNRVTPMKGGVKSISQVPGTSVVIAFAAPWFADGYGVLAYYYNSDTLLVATGPEDKPLPDDKLLDVDLTNSHKIKFSAATFYKVRVLAFPK